MHGWFDRQSFDAPVVALSGRGRSGVALATVSSTAFYVSLYPAHDVGVFNLAPADIVGALESLCDDAEQCGDSGYNKAVEWHIVSLSDSYCTISNLTFWAT
jgi:hypothetical protein